MDQHHLELVAILTGLMLFSYWLIYCYGSPLNDDAKHVDTRAILGFVPYYLAQRRLEQKGLLKSARSQYQEGMRFAADLKEKVQTQRDYDLDIVIAGRFFFTWERSLLCAVCFHWWLTCGMVAFLVGTGFVRCEDLGLVALTYLVNHLFIRKI